MDIAPNKRALAWMVGRMNRWINGWMDERSDITCNGRAFARMDRRMNGRLKKTEPTVKFAKIIKKTIRRPKGEYENIKEKEKEKNPGHVPHRLEAHIINHSCLDSAVSS